MTREEQLPEVAIKMLLAKVGAELYTAMKRYPKQPTIPGCYAVLLEEVEEFWQEVKLYKTTGTDAQTKERFKAMKHELIQVAAMALRPVLENIDPILAELGDENEL